MPSLQQNIDQAYNDLAARFPKRYGVKNKLYLSALLQAFAQGDGWLETLYEQVRLNLRVVNGGQGKYLDAAAAKYGVTRPLGSGVGDDDYRQLVPLVGPSPKQILYIFQNILNVAYGPYITAANLTSAAPQPYRINVGAPMIFFVDAQTTIEIEFSASDAVNLAAATAQEVADAIISKSFGKIIGSPVINYNDGQTYLNCRTATIGNQGFLKAVGGDVQSSLLLGTIRPTQQGIGTWTVTHADQSDGMLFTLDSGTDPALAPAGVIPGDSVTIREDSGFSPANTGTFIVIWAGVGFFSVHNNAGVLETVTQAHANDLTFFNAYTANILQDLRVATVTEDAPNELVTTLPVTSPIARRNPQTAWYLHGASAVAQSATGSTLTVDNAAAFQPAGVFRPTYTRQWAQSTISGVTSNTITVANVTNFPTTGAVYSDVTQQYYYYSGITGNQLENVTPVPPSGIVDSEARYDQRYLYAAITGNQFTGVFPDPTGVIGSEIVQANSQLSEILGSYLYDSHAPYQTYEQSTTLVQNVRQGDFLTLLQVTDCSAFPPQGYIEFEGYTENAEGPIEYLATIGTQALILNPKNPFDLNHLPGTTIRLVSLGAYQPNLNNTDYPLWATSAAPIRDLIEQYIQQVAAAGVFLEFDIITPPFPWPLPELIFASDPLATSY